MKNKKGFTLIELLAVIVILAILMVVAVPKILDVIENSRKSAAVDSAYGYIKAIELSNSMSMISEDYQQINSTDTLDEINSKIKIKGTGPTEINNLTISDGRVQTISMCIIGYEVEYKDGKATSKGKCGSSSSEEEKVVYTEKILNGTDPVLSDNLVPVTIDNDGTVKKADLYSNWYSYANKRWANAVILEDATQVYTEGQVIPEANIESYFVWIPRYKYQIFDLGTYETYSGTTQPDESNVKEIQIVFEDKETAVSNGNAVGEYLSHPAFQAFNTNGLWVGKFETTGSIDNLTVKPGLASIREQTVKSMFDAAYNYKSSNESHMMKNTEWGAVVYLSHSKYGINTEVNINNNSSYLTGYSAVDGTNQSKYPGTYGTDSRVTLAYNTDTGYKASTTGNITGVYDMSGGAHEYMSSYKDGQYGSSGYTTDPITNYTNGEKYFDKYSSTSTWTSFNNRILGDATGEMGPFYQYKDSDDIVRNHSSWYADRSDFVYSSITWFCRGGYYANGVLAGQFHFDRGDGGSDSSAGFRLVLAG